MKVTDISYLQENAKNDTLFISKLVHQYTVSIVYIIHMDKKYNFYQWLLDIKDINMENNYYYNYRTSINKH